MKGFFTRKETESKTRPMGKKHSCISCGLYTRANTPKMEVSGNGAKGIMNVGDFPTELDDERGEHWQGKPGRMLRNAYEKLGIDLEEDCYNINATNCYSETPATKLQIDCCRTIMVMKAIETYKPKLIVVFGNDALYSLIGNRWKKGLNNGKSKNGAIDTWRGFCIPDQELHTWVCPVYNPNMIITQNRKEVQTVWEQDLERAIECLKKPFPVWKEPTIETITDLSVLNVPGFAHSDYYVMPQAAFDYETTGLKPHAEGHEIVCCSVADGPDHVYVFMMPKTRRELKPFITFLANEKIAKIAANMKYEHVWSQIRLRTEVQGWTHDTMQAGHILDNRTGVTGLKFQVFTTFGIADYDSDIAPYLRSKTFHSSNDLNQIYDLLELPGGKEKLLKYCAMDSICEYRLAMVQRKIMEPKLGKK
jgi:uracil-DNA glycosylase family 4